MPSQSTTNVGLISGLVVGLSCGLGFLVGAYFWIRRRRFRQLHATDADSPKNPTKTESSRGSGEGMPAGLLPYPNELDVDDDDDISTLGDPLPPGMTRQQETDGSTVGPTSMTYDFRKAYGSVEEGSSEGSGHLETLTDDDGTLGAQYMELIQFHVEAPPGMLGLVLEGGSDGVPVVHAIKSTSPLSEIIQVGDRLLTVDGDDVALMLASDVSRMIAVKRDQPVRRFVFARPQHPVAGGAMLHTMTDPGTEGGVDDPTSIEDHTVHDTFEDPSFDSQDETYNEYRSQAENGTYVEQDARFDAFDSFNLR